jgi:hypothetical protein
MRFLYVVLFLMLRAAAQPFTVDQLAHQPLTNENVVTLAKAGFDELFILQLIRNSRTNFDTSVDGLVALKKTGISEDLIRMMAMPQTVPAPAPAAPTAKPPAKKHGFLFKHSANERSGPPQPAPAAGLATTKS